MSRNKPINCFCRLIEKLWFYGDCLGLPSSYVIASNELAPTCYMPLRSLPAFEFVVLGIGLLFLCYHWSWNLTRPSSRVSTPFCLTLLAHKQAD